MKKKAFSFYLKYPNGGTSHARKKFERRLIENEIINLLNEREVLDDLADEFILKHGDRVIFQCKSRELTDQKIKEIKFPKTGQPLQYPERVQSMVTEDDKKLLEELGKGEVSAGIREIIRLYKSKKPL